MVSYKREDYVFNLPEELIAQSPAEQRDGSRLLVAGRSGEPEHRLFHDLSSYLKSGDLLILNQTRVMNARCFGFKENGVRIEIFVLGIQVDPGRVPILARPAKRIKPGSILNFPESGQVAEVVEKGEMGKAWLSFKDMDALLAVITHDGQLPLPPYIKREDGPGENDATRYQTVFASELGAVAAPTAGLHFTQELLDKLREKGVQVRFVTHHVGIGTFKPLTADDIRDHEMEPESYAIEESVAADLNRAKEEGRRIIAVGTTSTRCLESNYNNGFHAGQFTTNHYIYPGYGFQAIDALITNFHLPGSSLILLVSALMGRERMMSLYKDAINRHYRFYSYGDAMLLTP